MALQMLSKDIMTTNKSSFFFFQAEDGIRDRDVTGVQTCALPISFILAEAGRPPFEDECRDAPRALPGVRPRQHDGDPADRRIGDEGLASVQDPLSVAPLGPRPEGGRVGAGARLGQPPGAEHLPRGQARQVPPLLRLGAERRDVVRAQRVVRPHRDADRGVPATELFDDQRVRDVIEAGAAVLVSHEHPEEAQRPELLHDLVGKRLALVVRRDRVPELTLCELTRDLAKAFLVVGQVEIHRTPPAAQAAARMCSRTKRTISWVDAPGVKISLTPIALSAVTSSGGMIPPPKTTMSAASFSRSSSRTRVKR